MYITNGIPDKILIISRIESELHHFCRLPFFSPLNSKILFNACMIVHGPHLSDVASWRGFCWGDASKAVLKYYSAVVYACRFFINIIIKIYLQFKWMWSHVTSNHVFLSLDLLWPFRTMIARRIVCPCIKSSNFSFFLALEFHFCF